MITILGRNKKRKKEKVMCNENEKVKNDNTCVEHNVIAECSISCLLNICANRMELRKDVDLNTVADAMALHFIRDAITMLNGRA